MATEMLAELSIRREMAEPELLGSTGQEFGRGQKGKGKNGLMATSWKKRGKWARNYSENWDCSHNWHESAPQASPFT